MTDSSSIGTAEDRVIENISENSIQLNVEEELWGPLLERGIYGIIGQNGDALVGNISLPVELLSKENSLS